MDARVSRLEEEMGEVRAILRRIEPMIVRIDAQFPYLATKAEAERLRHDLSSDIATLRHDVSTDIATLRQDVSTDIATLRQDVSNDIATLRHDVFGEISTLRTEAATFRGEILTELAHKPTRGAMWAMGIALFTLSLTGIAVGSVYLPYVAAKLQMLK